MGSSSSSSSSCSEDECSACSCDGNHENESGQALIGGKEFFEVGQPAKYKTFRITKARHFSKGVFGHSQMVLTVESGGVAVFLKVHRLDKGVKLEARTSDFTCHGYTEKDSPFVTTSKTVAELYSWLETNQLARCYNYVNNNCKHFTSDLSLFVSSRV